MLSARRRSGRAASPSAATAAAAMTREYYYFGFMLLMCFICDLNRGALSVSDRCLQLQTRAAFVAHTITHPLSCKTRFFDRGSFDDGDPFTTNLYVGNLAPDVTEQVGLQFELNVGRRCV